MRILQVHNTYRQPGGEDTVVRMEAELLSSNGHDVAQFVSQNPTSGFDSIGTLLFAGWNPVEHHKLTSEIKRFNPDVVHFHNTWFRLSPSVIAAAGKTRTKCIMTLHNYRTTCANGLLFRDGTSCIKCVKGSVLHAIVNRCYRDSFFQSIPAATTVGIHKSLRTWSRNIDRFICLSEFAKSVFSDTHIPAEKLIVRNNFVHDTKERTEPPSSSSAFLYIGRLSVEKGIENLIRVWKKLDDLSMTLEVIGDGPLKNFVQSNTNDRITYLGPLSHDALIEKIKRSRALVVPSICFEGQPMVMLEAAASGLPVIAANQPSIAEALQGNGILYNTLMDDELANAVRVFADDKRVNKEAKNMRHLYEYLFSPMVALRTLEEIYASA